MTKTKKVADITTHEELGKEMEKCWRRVRSLELQIKRTAKKLCLEHPDAVVKGYRNVTFFLFLRIRIVTVFN